jgi:hypothetical protein
MTSSRASELPVICDWLDATYAPTECPYPELNLLLLDAGFEVARDTGGSRCYMPPAGARGMIRIEHRQRFARISLSGGACSALRSLGLWEQVLMILGSSPHKVTRVDAALDLPLDAADVIRALCARYPEGKVNLSRKALPVTRMTQTRDDGQESGSYYVGRMTKARFTARVYDKSLEALSKRGEQLPTTTRFEVTACKDSGATLRDAALPAALFWHIAAPAFLTRPEGVPMWVPNDDQGWTAPKRAFDPAETLRRRVEGSAELEAFLDVADSMGASGRQYLLHLISRKLRELDDSQESPEAA